MSKTKHNLTAENKKAPSFFGVQTSAISYTDIRVYVTHCLENLTFFLVNTHSDHLSKALDILLGCLLNFCRTSFV